MSVEEADKIVPSQKIIVILFILTPKESIKNEPEHTLDTDDSIKEGPKTKA
jgi:hypothetical protein